MEIKNGQVEKIYTTSGGVLGQIISVRNQETDYYYHYDAIGNVIFITDSSGQIIAEYSQEGFGNVLVATGNVPNNYHLTTKEIDPDTGLYYFGARWYDPQTGRWISREPLGLDGPNLYHFTFNNPVNGVDIKGLWSWKPWTPDFYQPFANYFWGPTPGTDNKTANSLICDAVNANKTLGYDLYDIDQNLLYEAGNYTKEQINWGVIGLITDGGIYGLKGITKHGLDRILERGIKPYEILDALKNPISACPGKSANTTKLAGKYVDVVISEKGLLVSVWRPRH